MGGAQLSRASAGKWVSCQAAPCPGGPSRRIGYGGDHTEPEPAHRRRVSRLDRCDAPMCRIRPGAVYSPPPTRRDGPPEQKLACHSGVRWTGPGLREFGGLRAGWCSAPPRGAPPLDPRPLPGMRENPHSRRGAGSSSGDGLSGGRATRRAPAIRQLAKAEFRHARRMSKPRRG